MTVKWTPKPDLPPPPLDTGVAGWLKTNLFSSFWNGLLTVAGLLIILATVPPFLRWAVINAAWVGDSREACIHLGEDGISGACWVFIKVRLGMFMYGFYPDAERWRVNLAMVLLALAALPILMPQAFEKRRTALGFALAGTIAVFVLFGPGPGAAAGLLLVLPFGLPHVRLKTLFETVDAHPAAGLAVRAAALAIAGGVVYAAARGFDGNMLPGPLAGLFIALLLGLMLLDRAPAAAWQWIFLFTVYPFIAYVLLMGDAYGLAYVETHLWGGMFLTLVIAVIGIATSLPIGILLALGRRSTMPVTRTLCICFIELIRGVPLISVLFMASIMLPLFLPEGAHFDKLLRALIGVSLFYAAYMAEVVRGGLQAIPRGQYEAAESLGCGYWRMMGLIILPQALRLVIPGIVNTFLGLFKDTTLVAVIGLMDMLGIVKTALADTEWLGFPKEAYVFAAAVFWVFCFGMSRYSMHLEKRFQVRRH